MLPSTQLVAFATTAAWARQKNHKNRGTDVYVLPFHACTFLRHNQRPIPGRSTQSMRCPALSWWSLAARILCGNSKTAEATCMHDACAPGASCKSATVEAAAPCSRLPCSSKLKKRREMLLLLLLGRQERLCVGMLDSSNSTARPCWTAVQRYSVRDSIGCNVRTV